MGDLPLEQSSAARPAGRSLRAWALLLLLVSIGLTADLLTKHAAFTHLPARPVVLDRQFLIEHPEANPIPPHLSQALLPADLLTARLAINRGAVFGIAGNQRTFFIAFTVVVLSFALWLFVRMPAKGGLLGRVGIALAIAGGLGNLYDRIAFGVVRDFIQFLAGRRLPNNWTWPGGNPELMPWVFNIADVLLLVGMLMVLRHMALTRRAARAEASPSPA